MSEVEWIKITTDMFDNEKIRIIESMPDSDSILIIWIKLLTMAGKINANGYIFIREDISYTTEELSSAISRPLNTVRLALGTFEKYGMIHHNGGHPVITNWEKYQNIEGLAAIREKTRLRVARFRSKNKLLNEGSVTVTKSNATEENKNRVDKEEEKEENIPLQDIDEDNTIIHHQSISKIRRILTGKVEASEANKKIYRRELEKRGWLEEIEKE